MIQNLFQLKEEVHKYNAKYGEYHTGGQIQKIYSSTRYICMSIRYPQKTATLYLGRGKGHEGFWDGEGAGILPADLRISDPFLEFLRKKLKNMWVLSLDVDEYDRILFLSYRGAGLHGQMQFFWSGRVLYFLQAENNQQMTTFNTVFLSWNGEHQEVEKGQALVHLFDQVGRKKMELRPGKKKGDIKSLLEQEKSELSSFQESKKVKQLKQKVKNIEDDLAEARKWIILEKKVHQQEITEEDLLEKSQISIDGIKIKFDKNWSFYHKLDAFYKKIKKLKKGEEILSQRLRDAEMALIALKESGRWGKAAIDKSKIIRPAFGQASKATKSVDIQNKSVKEYVEYKLKSGHKLAIGKSAKGNDELRSEWASKEDWWFHLDNFQSSHLIIKISSLAQLSAEELSLLGSLIVAYSKLEISSIPLLFTQVKYIKGVKGSPGKVIYKKEKRLLVNFDPEWKQKI